MIARSHIAIAILFVQVLFTAVSQAGPLEDLKQLEAQLPEHYDHGRYREAEQLALQAVKLAERSFSDRPAVLAGQLNSLANIYSDQGRYAEAEPLLLRSLEIRRRVLGELHNSTAHSYNDLGVLYSETNRYAESEASYRQSLAIREKLKGPDHPDVGTTLNNLGNVYSSQGRFSDAETAYKRALTIHETALGPDNPSVGLAVNNLAVLHEELGRYAEAEALYKRAGAIWEKAYGTQHPRVATVFDNLGVLYRDQARFSEAERLHKQAMEIRSQFLSPEHPDMAICLNHMAMCCVDDGRYAEAEVLYKRALAIFEKSLGPDHRLVAENMINLSQLYESQGRPADAVPLCRRSISILEQVLGNDHPGVAIALFNLANVYHEAQQLAEAEAMHRRALTIREKTLGPEHPEVAASLNNLANVLLNQGRYDEAAPLQQRALAMKQKVFGKDHPSVASSLFSLASVHASQNRNAEAEPLVEQAIGILERAKVDPDFQFKCYKLRGELSWKTDRKQQALADLRRAIELAEAQRGNFSGADADRAQAFLQFTSAYELMVEWQRQLGDTAEAFAAAERSRARSLVDQMATAHVDLLAGLSDSEAEPLRQQERAAQSQLAGLERQLEAARSRSDLKEDERRREVESLEIAVIDARQRVVDAYIAIRNASPAYRQTVAQNFRPVGLSDVQARLAGEDRLMLEYVLARDAGYVIVVPPVGQPPRIETLTVDAAQAKTLGVKAGPLTSEVLKQALMNDDGSGVLQLLHHEAKAVQATDKLAALYAILLPGAERATLVEGQLKRLIVVPDGPLSLLPFETLVVEPGDDPKYLLDVGVPLTYAPSATLLYNLAEQHSAAKSLADLRILSIGDPNYSRPKADAATANDVDVQLATRSRYGALRGELAPLPYSGLESTWVIDTFRRQGIATDQLQKAQATEANVRRRVRDQQLIHLACHGLTDQSYGNLFGALAMTPGPRADSGTDDDGFLTLAEIYGLNLKGCELAILSACETNYGPQQRGEGVWALSRGFLVAGSRRVVASNWLVDDEAAASLVSVFCDRLAKDQKSESVDYAAAMSVAKKWVRDQEKWKSPYYWGTFVLVGPN